MSSGFVYHRVTSAAALATILATLASAPALAQQTPAEKAVANLIDALVEQGALQPAQADTLRRKFQEDLQAASGSAAPVTPAPDLVRVPYVPQLVQERIRDDVKSAVIAQAKAENWATPNAFPEWVSRLTVQGDVRAREENRNFDAANYWGFVNVGAINGGSPYNVGSDNNELPPISNSVQDRNLLRLRARLGVNAQIDDAWTASVRIATGSDSSPVSTNQSLGGYFSKKSVWLDQGYIRYEPAKGNGFVLGRMPNPFDRTELVWDDDINLDGLAASLSLPFSRSRFAFRATAGAFPLQYVPDDFPATATSDLKAPRSGDKWLYAGQLGVAFNTKPARMSLSAAYYDFNKVQGDLSPACSNLASFCLTDFTRPAFMQKGNTLFALRDFTFPDPDIVSQPQYFGIAAKFRVVDVVAKLDLRATERVHVVFTANYARNLAFDSESIQTLPIVNNNETCSVTVPADETCDSAGGANLFKSGNNAWFLRLAAGAPEIAERGDWNAWFSYSRIEPDALLDAFTDSDFHLGGTNAKGWGIGGAFGLARRTTLSARWLSADALTGPPFSVDVMQLDLTTRF